MPIRLGRFEMPNRLAKDDAASKGNYAKFVAEPFEAGYGHTLGNSLRRVLLSSLEGAAISSIKLEGARQAIHAEGVNAQTMESLYLRAHDLKGLGTTYGFPLITRIAASLCKLTDTPERRAQASLFLIDSHIDAIKACVRDDIRNDSHPTGRALAEELERRVAESQSAG